MACNGEVAEAMLRAGAEVNAKAAFQGNSEDLVTPLDLASSCGILGDTKTVSVLLANGGDGEIYRELKRKKG